MKLMVPAIRPAEPDTYRLEAAAHTLNLLDEIDALLDESFAALARHAGRRLAHPFSPAAT
jgi:hypothetical protein